MKQILEQFLVRIDENGKEVEKPELKGDNPKDIVFGYTEQLVKHSNATEVIKLPTLSEFWKALWNKYSTVTEYESVYFNDYVNFLQQRPTKEMLIGKDAIFVGWNKITDIWGFNNIGTNYDDVVFDGINECLIDGFNSMKTIEQALNNNATLYLNPDKI